MVTALYRATTTFFWLLLLASQLPMVSALWLASKLLKMSGSFRSGVMAPDATPSRCETAAESCEMVLS
jgi:hypothetical protein